MHQSHPGLLAEFGLVFPQSPRELQAVLSEVPVVATVGDFKQFKNGAQFGAWIGLTPRQRSSGGKNNLSGIYPSVATPTCVRC